MNIPEINKSLPHSAEFETVILGSILMDARLITQALDQLTEDDFYSPSHRLVFNAMARLDQQGQTINHLLIADELKANDRLTQVGGVVGIVNMTRGLPHSTNLTPFIKTLKEKTKARQLIKTCNDTITHLLADADFDLVSETAEQAFFALRSEESANLKPFGGLLEESVTKLKERMKPDYTPNVLRTGYRGLDDRLFGIDVDDLVILGGRPSQGKSTLALNFVNNITKSGGTVLFFSLEMSERQVVDKLICLELGIEYSRYRAGTVSGTHTEAITAGFTALHGRRLILDSSSSLTPLQLKSRARRLKQQRGSLDLIVVDYLQMMRGNGKFNSRENEVAQISKDLKATAKDLKVPILAVCSLNRANESRADKRPTMSDLRESGQIESDANIVMFIHRPEMYATSNEQKLELAGQAEVIVSKNREGETGFEQLMFDGSRGRFLDL
jgi:replicative DNA helicase